MAFMIGIGLYFFILLIIGFLASRHTKSIEDYIVAGRKLPLFLAVPTVVATWFGAGSLMGVSGTVYSQGFYGVIADPFGCSLALIIAGLFFAVPFRRLRLMTISDILHQAYGPSFERIATVFMIPLYIGTLASQMLAMGYIFHIVAGWPVETGIVLGSMIVISYTVFGGMWAVTLTDLVQCILLIIGVLIVFFICLEHTENLTTVTQKFMHQFSTLIPNENKETNWSSYLGRILMTGLGAIMGQDLIQRLLASKNEEIARKSAIIGGFLYLLLGMIPLFIGVAGQEILPNLAKPEQLIPLLAERYLSPFVFSLFACGLLAAVMSTADSYLLAGTSLVVNNILLKKWPKQTEKQKIKLLQCTNIVVAIIALALAFSGTTIFDLMVHSGATLFVSIFVPVCFALFYRSTHVKAAWASLFSGFFSWLAFIGYHYQNLAEHHEDVLFSAAFFGASISFMSYLLVYFFLPVPEHLGSSSLANK